MTGRRDHRVADPTVGDVVGRGGWRLTPDERQPLRRHGPDAAVLRAADGGGRVQQLRVFVLRGGRAGARVGGRRPGVFLLRQRRRQRGTGPRGPRQAQVLQELSAQRVCVRAARVVHVRRRPDIPEHRGRRGRHGRLGVGRRRRQWWRQRIRAAGRLDARAVAEPDGRVVGRRGRGRGEPCPHRWDHLGDHGQPEHTVPGELDPVGQPGAEPVPGGSDPPALTADGDRVGGRQLSRGPGCRPSRRRLSAGRPVWVEFGHVVPVLPVHTDHDRWVIIF